MATTRKKTSTAKTVEISNIIPLEIRQLDIKDIASYKVVMEKISAGIILLSSFYCRFISTVFPMFETMQDNYSDINLLKFMIDRFNFLIKTYILSNDQYFDDNEKQSNIINESYTFTTIIDGSETDISLTLRFIHSSFKEFILKIRKSFLSKVISDKDIEDIKNYIRDIYLEYESFVTDLVYIFYSEEFVTIADELMVKIDKDMDTIKIGNLKDIYTESNKLCLNLKEIYKVINIIEYGLNSSMNISDPMNVSNQIKEIYDNAFNPKKAEELMDLLVGNNIKGKYKN